VVSFQHQEKRLHSRSFITSQALSPGYVCIWNFQRRWKGL